MKQATKMVFTIVIILIVIDFLGMIAWAMSGQFPTDNFYIGSISTHIIRAIIF